MTIFYIGWVLFFIPHFYSAARSRGEGRDMRAKIGEAKYMGLYSVVTGLGLGLLIWGYVKAPQGDIVFAGPHGLHHYAWVVMIPALILLISAYTPLGYIKRAAQHPMMLAILIWTLLHLALGGDLKHVLLFGSFALYALVSLCYAFKRGAQLKDKAPNIVGDIMAIVIGLIVSGALLHGLHNIAFGVPAM